MSNQDNNLSNFVLHLVTDVNNFLMEQSFKGDSTIAAADLMKRCHAVHNALTPKADSVVEEVSTEEPIA